MLAGPAVDRSQCHAHRAAAPLLALAALAGLAAASRVAGVAVLQRGQGHAEVAAHGSSRRTVSWTVVPGRLSPIRRAMVARVATAGLAHLGHNTSPGRRPLRGGGAVRLDVADQRASGRGRRMAVARAVRQVLRRGAEEVDAPDAAIGLDLRHGPGGPRPMGMAEPMRAHRAALSSEKITVLTPITAAVQREEPGRLSCCC